MGKQFPSVRDQQVSRDNINTIQPDHSPLFCYTSGRYLFNEHLRLKERFVKFNVEALLHAAEDAIERQHGRVTSIEKIAEGGFNRVFALKFQDDFEVIAKVPYHMVSPRSLATASEAATLTYLRLKGIPVPEVYSYSKTDLNPVGTEYIIMEKAPGVSLASRWMHLEDIEIRRLAHSFVELAKQLFEIPFGTTGSLYFKKDVSSDLQGPLHAAAHTSKEDEQFCIGPIADYMFWYGRRAGIKLDRGPWTDPVQYLWAIAQKEIDWTRRYGASMEPDIPHNDIGLSLQRPEDYLKLLESYQLLTPHLLPKDGAHPFNRPTLRHPDLTPANIFINSETGRISCLIDWQHTVIQPLLLTAGYPRAFENPDDELTPELKQPKLPKDFDSLPEEDKVAARELHHRRLLFFVYRVFNGHFNQLHIGALRDPLLRGRQMLVDRASRQWEGNLMTLKGALVRAVQFWRHLPDVEGIKCPIRFERTDLDKFAEDEDNWLAMSTAVELWRKGICSMTEEGWVRNEEYDEAKKKLADLKEDIRGQCEGDEEDIQAFRSGWPFRDREEID